MLKRLATAGFTTTMLGVGTVTEEDVRQVTALRDTLNDEHVPLTVAMVTLAFNESREIVYVARDDHHAIIGTITLAFEQVGETRQGLIKGFVVDDHAQGKGVGRRLLEMVLSIADQGGLSEVRLRTREERTVARHLYSNHGFTQSGVSGELFVRPRNATGPGWS